MSIRKLINCVGITSAVSMAVIPAIFAVAPAFQASDTNAATASSRFTVTAGVDQAIAFSTTPKVTMSGTQTIGETIFTTGYGNVSLDTNAVGYAIQLSTTDSNLVNQDTLTTSTKNKSIPSIESSQTGTQMLADATLGSSWGFTKESVSGTQGNSTDLTRTYSPVSGTTTISDMDFYDEDYTGVENFNVGYGVKVSPDLRTGKYTGTVKFTVVGYVPVLDLTTIFDIDTMQQISPKICKNTTTPLVSATEITYVKTTDNTKIPRTTLIDERDGKTYLVSKFADGHCWMSQNLELELDTETALTSELTDLNTKETWTPSSGMTTISQLFSDIYDEYGNYNYQYSSYPYSAYYPDAGSEYITGDGTLSGAPSTNDGKSEWEKLGYYYNASAATAGSHSNSNCGDYYWDLNSAEHPLDCTVKDSICPKGWSLPDVGEFRFSYYMGDGSCENCANNEFIETYRDTIEGVPRTAYAGTKAKMFAEQFALNPATTAASYATREITNFAMYDNLTLLLWTNVDSNGLVQLYFSYYTYTPYQRLGYNFHSTNDYDYYYNNVRSQWLGGNNRDYIRRMGENAASIRCVARD